MFSASEVGRERRFHGWAAATSGSRPTSVNQLSSGQLPVERAMARMPSSVSFSTGLPSTQPAARPSQDASSRERSASRSTGPSAGRATRGTAP